MRHFRERPAAQWPRPRLPLRVVCMRVLTTHLSQNAPPIARFDDRVAALLQPSPKSSWRCSLQLRLSDALQMPWFGVTAFITIALPVDRDKSARAGCAQAAKGGETVATLCSSGAYLRDGHVRQIDRAGNAIERRHGCCGTLLMGV